MDFTKILHDAPRPGLRSLVSLASLLLTLGIAVGLFVLGVFVYTALYQTIAQTDQIILLRREVAPDAIDTKKVEELTRLLNEKVSPASQTNWASARNPFTAPAASPSPTPPASILPVTVPDPASSVTAP